MARNHKSISKAAQSVNVWRHLNEEIVAGVINNRKESVADGSNRSEKEIISIEKIMA